MIPVAEPLPSPENISNFPNISNDTHYLPSRPDPIDHMTNYNIEPIKPHNLHLRRPPCPQPSNTPLH